MSKRPLSLRLSVLGLLGLLVVLQVRFWLADDGWQEVSRLRVGVAEQQSKNEKMAERNARLEAEVSDLKVGFSALEERARSDLGMVGPDESFYMFIPANAEASTAN